MKGEVSDFQGAGWQLCHFTAVDQTEWLCRTAAKVKKGLQRQKPNGSLCWQYHKHLQVSAFYCPTSKAQNNPPQCAETSSSFSTALIILVPEPVAALSQENHNLVLVRS